MTNQQPLVSVIIPSFNREKLIGETLQSVLDQTYSHWECIIVDDGSTDGTIDIVQSFVKKDNRFKLYKRHREPKGAPTCRNIGIERSKGEYIIFLDSDDIMLEDCINSRLQITQEKPCFDFYIFPVRIFYNGINDSKYFLNKEFDKKFILSKFLSQDMPWITCSAFWRRTTVTTLDGFDEDLISWQDWDLHVRAIIFDFKFHQSSNNFTSPIFYRQDSINTIRSYGKHEKIIINRLKLFKKTYQLLANKSRVSEHRKPLAQLIFTNVCKSDEFNVKNIKLIKDLKLIPYFDYFLWVVYAKTLKTNGHSSMILRLLNFYFIKIRKYHIGDLGKRTFKKWTEFENRC
ncbi:glycosyltransferase family 2 protein [Reichenbachiella ulvae]|uniref:Glycosyltransferase n=1 Tax=Reichenbachiella ulvae TaxID=2980104 RepID=A0ABT3CYN6_9BACT|nr:glycosyltransferase [Reichenbachiella ulvae]MCV9388810.1 glycosyltransferase [Reichenbachiella ulvae]